MSDLLELQDIHLNYKTESTAVEVIRGVSLKIIVTSPWLLSEKVVPERQV